MARRLPALAVLALALAVVAGCGLRLQGREAAPQAFASAYLEAGDMQSDFVQALARSLAASGVRLERDAVHADAVVRILRDEVKERVLSVSARNIPREYELTYRVEFSVQKDGAELLAPREAALTRDFTFDETILLAKEREQRLLEDALARDLAAIVMRQLAAL
jgi:LPS-assembly lipoprotein